MPKRRFLVPLLLVVGLLAVPAASQAYITGVADQSYTMFNSPLYRQLFVHTPSSHRISRYLAPYDVADGNRKNSFFRDEFIRWYQAASANHVNMLVAFYHSELTPSKMPNTKVYQADVTKFIREFPHVKTYQPWNEANRGTIRHVLASPSPFQAAQYYKILHAVCRRCTIPALDVLDQNNIGPSLRYVAQFRAALRRLRVPTPRLWGLHNYSDTNRFSEARTKAILRAVPGQVWLTETGGIVNFGGAFPNRNGSGDKRAAKALTYMFKIAGSSNRLARLYIFQWSGATAVARFDAGLLDKAGKPRPGYVIVCRKLHGAKCTGLKVDSKH